MASRITRENERNIRTNDFLQTNIGDFAGNTFAMAQIELLRAKMQAAGNAREMQISKHGAARQQYEIAEEATDALKQAMRDIADFAVTMADDIEGIEEKFRIPRSGGKRGRIASARAFAADAVEYKAMFIERGLASDFIEDLTQKADALEQSLESASAKTAERVGSTESKLQAHKEANKIIARLNPIVQMLYRNNQTKLSEWNFATHVQRDDKPKPPSSPTA